MCLGKGGLDRSSVVAKKMQLINGCAINQQVKIEQLDDLKSIARLLSNVWK